MSAKILDGKSVAQRIWGELTPQVEELKKRGKTPHLVVVQGVRDPAARVYVNRIETGCERTGIRFQRRKISPESTETELLGVIDELNADPEVSGIILQMPLPEGVDVHHARIRIDPAKDVERVNPTNIGLVVYQKPDLAPCTAMAAVEMVKASGIEIRGKEAVVVGHSEIVGKPAALLLLDRLATTTVCHVATRDLAAHTRLADILVVAVGKAGLIRADMVKPGAVVVDVGINKVDTPDGKSRLVGDVDFEGVKEKAGWITPVPGGVGPVTIAMVIRNTVLSATGWKI